MDTERHLRLIQAEQASNRQLAHHLRQGAEELSQALADAQAGLRTRDALLTSLSHQFQTPLNGIIGLAEILAADAALGSEQRHYADLIVRSGRSLNHRVQDVLVYGKLRSGEMTVSNHRFRLPDLAEELVATYGPIAAERGLDLVCACTGDCPEEVVSDHFLLGHLLGNLVDNALHQAQTRVAVRWSRGSEGSVVVVVVDDGPGLPAEEVERMLAGNDLEVELRPAADGGIGLGLIVARGLAHLLGSRIHWHGTETGCHLSFALEAAMAGAEVATAWPDTAGLMVLAAGLPEGTAAVVAEMARSGGGEWAVWSGDEREFAQAWSDPATLVVWQPGPGEREWSLAALGPPAGLALVLAGGGVPVTDRCLVRPPPLSQTLLAEALVRLRAVRSAIRADTPSNAIGPEVVELAALGEPLRGVRVLLVEPVSERRSLAMKVLQRLPLDLVRRNDPEAAMGALGESEWDVVVVDLDLDGLHLSGLLSSMVPRLDRAWLLVVAGGDLVTSLARQGFGERLVALDKPLRRSRLLAALRRVARERREH